MKAKMARNAGVVKAGEQVIGSRVINLEGEDLGKVEEVMIDATNGRVTYAILSFGGFLGIGDKLFALPWPSLSYNPESEAFVLKANKHLLEKAPGFDKSNWPDLSDPMERAHLSTYYGVDRLEW